ncbi:MAG: hypothetical protein IJQ85_10240 [Selenomonadaceae bacterium]|nr:hypothetical protein [Selenomonadaceae bacterium]
MIKIATREENIKKINEGLNEQLEKLSDEELEQVAGGNIFDDIADWVRSLPQKKRFE